MRAKRLMSLVAVLALALIPAAPANAMTISHAKRQIAKLVKKDYTVVRGPYITNCRGSKRYIKCDVDFRAGLYERCGYGSVKLHGGYETTTLRVPICG